MPFDPPCDLPRAQGHRSEEPGTTLEEVVDRYLQEIAEGGSPDRRAYLEAHPSLGEALHGIFKTLDFVEATGQSLKTSGLEHGRQLGEFRIVREVARGGMGVVYEAIQTSLDRRVALKVLPMGALLSDTAATRFAREALTAAHLHHTSIVPVYAVGEEQGIRFYVMQYIDGLSLAEHLRRLRAGEATLDPDHYARVARWGQQVAEALEYAHGEGIIHRDIKPSNLLLDARDHIWITDFGLARTDTHTTLTLTGDVLGTTRYLPPEQAGGHPAQIDGRSDIYSLGATLYELLALAPAFDGESREAVLNQIILSDPIPLRRRDPAIPRDLETIVAKCMQKKPDHRYARALDVAEDCRRFLVGGPIRARRTSALVKAGRFVRRHQLLTLGSLVVLALAVTTSLLARSLQQERGQRRVDEALNVILFERDANRAETLLTEAQSQGVDSAELHLYRGLTFLFFGKPQLALRPLHAALDRDPNHVETTLALAFAYTATGDTAQGELFLNRHDERQLNTALAWLLRGLALTSSGGDAPIEAFDRAVALRPDYIPALEERAVYRSNRVLIEGLTGDLEPMLRDFDAWVVFRPSSSRAYASRALGRVSAAACTAKLPNARARSAEWLDGARRDLEQAMALRSPGELGPYMRSGSYLAYVGDFRGMADNYAEAIAIDRAATGQTHPGFVSYRAIGLHALGDFETALREIEAAATGFPSLWILVPQRALLLAELGRLEEARQVVRIGLDGQSDVEAQLIFTTLLEFLGEPGPLAALLRQPARVSSQPATAPGTDPAPDDPTLAYLACRIPAESLLASVEGHPGRCCATAFLVGLHELGLGHREAGRAALSIGVQTGVHPYLQYRLAQVLLARLEQDPQWPPWVSAGIP